MTATDHVARRAKIVCTLGPATASADAVVALVDAGMDVARLNLSHGSHDEHAALAATVRSAAAVSGRTVAVLADLAGPKVRLGRFAHGPVLWRPGETVTITTDPVEGDHDRVSTSYAGLCGDVGPGDLVLVADGALALRVVAVEGPDVRCDVEQGGVVSDHNGLNLPGVAVSAPVLTGKDTADLRFALSLPVDLVALSFVRAAGDAEAVRAVMAEVGVTRPVLAKVEKPQAVDGLEAVIDAFDGVMVARGDLGVELPLEQVPHVQRRAIQLCREAAKPVIVATQMLESMVRASRPTRAEASDVAHAVLEGADALMLSAETSVGDFATEAVATMVRIVVAAEADLAEALPPLSWWARDRGSAVAAAAVEVADRVGAVALAGFTQTGASVRRLARHRPGVPLVALSTQADVLAQLALVWGVQGELTRPVHDTDHMYAEVDTALTTRGFARSGDIVVVVSGNPPNTPGSTNTLRVHRVGEVGSV